MKKFLALMLTLVLLIGLTPTVFATTDTIDDTTYTEIINYDDGSYIVISEIEETSQSRASSSITGSKTAKYYNSNDVVQWSITLTGTFTYTGSSATCTASRLTYSIANDHWKFTSTTASKSGNKAKGNAIAKYYTLGIPLKTIETDIAITCSATGSLS